MTSYTSTITLNDGEIGMMYVALKLLIENCQEKLDEGKGAPYWAHKNSAERVLEK